jgi:hypothetical protein
MWPTNLYGTMEAAEAILGIPTPWLAVALAGNDFSEKRYKALRMRWALELEKRSPRDKELLYLSTRVDDALDIIGLLPMVDKVTRRRWCAQVLQVAYGIIWVNRLVGEFNARATKAAEAVDAAGQIPARSAELVGVRVQSRSRKATWLDYVISPVTQDYLSSGFRRFQHVGEVAKDLGGTSEELLFALLHLQRGLSSSQDAQGDAEQWLYFHAAKVLEEGLGLFEAVQAYCLSKTDETTLKKAPRLSQSHLENIVERGRRNPSKSTRENHS